MSTGPLVVDLAQRITTMCDDAGLTIVERMVALKIAEALLSLSDASFTSAPRPLYPPDAPRSAGP